MQRGEEAPTEAEASETARTPADRVDITSDQRAFTVLLRNALFSVLRSLARKDWESAAQAFEGEGDPVTPSSLEASFAPFFEQHSAVRLDPAGRSPRNTRIVSRGEAFWQVEQIVADPEAFNDWALFCRVDLERSRAAGHPVLTLDRIGT